MSLAIAPAEPSICPPTHLDFQPRTDDQYDSLQSRSELRKTIPDPPTNLEKLYPKGKGKSPFRPNGLSASKKPEICDDGPAIYSHEKSRAKSDRPVRSVSDSHRQDSPANVLDPGSNRNDDSSISVTVFPTRRERLIRAFTHLRPTSRSECAADTDRNFTTQEWDTLKDFSNSWTRNHSTWFANLPLNPDLNLELYLVSLQRRPGQLKPVQETFICISGFSCPEEAGIVHATLSKRSMRRFCTSLKLCYEVKPISLAASTGTIVSETETNSSWSLCGKRLVTQTTSGNQVSTIGGLVESGGEFFALTSLHSAQPEISEPTSSYELREWLATYVAELVDTHELDDEKMIPTLFLNTSIHHGNIGPLPTTYILQNSHLLLSEGPGISSEQSDHRLVTVDLEHRLPNCLDTRDLTTLPHQLEDRIYFTQVDNSSVRKRVLIAGGVSGLTRGMLMQNSSLLHIGPENSLIVRKVKLDPGVSLQKGDSGSWVFDVKSRSVIGSTIAFSAREAYVLRMPSSVGGKKIQLPSPFDLLADLAYYHWHKNRILKSAHAQRTAQEALSEAVLNHDCISTSAKLIRSAEVDLSSTANVLALCLFLCHTGAALQQYIGEGGSWELLHEKLVSPHYLSGLELQGVINPASADLTIQKLGGQIEVVWQKLKKAEPRSQKELQPKRDQPVETAEPEPASLQPTQTSILAVFALNTFLESALGAAAGVACVAAGTSTTAQAASSSILSLGAIGGALKPAVYNLLLVFVFAGIKISQQFTSVATGSPKVITVVVLLAVILVSAFLTPLVIGIAVTTKVESQLLIAGLAASGPLFVEIGSIPLMSSSSWAKAVTPEAALRRYGQTWKFVCWIRIPPLLVGTGFDALVGFTFAKVLNQQGIHSLDVKAAATAGGVFGFSLSILAWLWSQSTSRWYFRGHREETGRSFKWGNYLGFPPRTHQDLLYKALAPLE